MRVIRCLLFLLIATASFAQFVTTPNYSLKKPDSGIRNWGTYVNDNMDTIDAKLFHLTPQSLSGVVFADQFPGVDIGAKINAAYAALPAGGGTIIIPPTADGSCYNYTTPIVATTAGKYLLLEGVAASGATGLSSAAGCLNFTPTSGNAITLDYTTNPQSSLSAVHGLRDLVLINNNCFTTGGCGSSAVGIMTGTTNQGTYEATMQNVSVIGFGTGYSDLNNFSVDILWVNPQFFFNTVAVTFDHPTGIYFHAGTIASNGTAFRASGASSTAELDVFATQFFGNTALAFDYTNLTTQGAQLNLFDVHLEDSPAGTANYINGKVDLYISGGLIEEDNASGTTNWMINATGQKVIIEGATFSCARTCTTVVAANSPVRGKIAGFDGSNGHFTNYVNGANANNVTQMVSAGPSTTPAVPWVFESSLKTPFVASGGTAATLSGTGACASRSTQSGGAAAGQITCTGTTGASTLTITPGATAANGWSCWASDITHTLAGSQSAASTTAPVMTFSSVTANDVVTFGCMAY